MAVIRYKSKEFNRVYNLLNIEFDSLLVSHFIQTDAKGNKGIRRKEFTEESNGAQIVDLEPYSMPPALIRVMVQHYTQLEI